MATQWNRSGIAAWAITMSGTLAPFLAGATANGQCEKRWEAIGPSSFGKVPRALAMMPDGSLIAASTLGIPTGPMSYIARWDGQVWSPLGAGPGGPVNALVVHPDGSLIAAGEFRLDGVDAGVARWNGTQWSLLTSAENSVVLAYALVVDSSGDIVAGGVSSVAGVGRSSVSRWNGSNWIPLGSGVTRTRGAGVPVAALAILPEGSPFAGDLIAGGSFIEMDGVTANKVARWDGASWHPLGALDRNSSSYVRCLTTLPNGGLVAGWSWFENSQGFHQVAQWDGNEWSRMGDGLGDHVFSVQALEDGTVVATGSFTSTAKGAQSPIAAVARWDGTAWTQVGLGVTDIQLGTAVVYTALALPGGDLIAGGHFTHTGNVPVRNLARFTSPCRCPADVDNDGDFANGLTRDGAVTIEDLLSFLVGFEASNVLVDLDNGTSTGTPDNAVDINDLLFFLARFEAGC